MPKIVDITAENLADNSVLIPEGYKLAVKAYTSNKKIILPKLNAQK